MTQKKTSVKKPAAVSTAKKKKGNTGKKRRQSKRSPMWLLLIVTVAVLDVVLVVSAISRNVGKEEKIDYSRYPMKYTELIGEYADRYGLENAYVASVILAESSYDPQAVSSVNAQGLMQLMPATGEWVASKLGETYYDGCLFDPETNIRYGCWYLGFLMDRYNGDRKCSSAAYHSGQGTVDNWLKDSRWSPDGVTLETIPGDNANTYVDRVLRYYEIYETLYDENGKA